MFQITKKELNIGGRTMSFETGKIARQADGAVFAHYGDTTVLATVVADKKAKEGIDFFPLTVHYQEKYFATGRIPGGFHKREGRSTEKETLVSRLIDRPVRPLFAEGFYHETQVIVTCMSHDLVNDPDVLAINAASAALTLSGVPFMGPIGAARVGYIDGQFVLNPTYDQMKTSDLDLIVAGTKEGVLMVESMASELDEDTMLKAVMFGWEGFQPVIDTIIALAERAAKDPWDLPVVNPNLAALNKDMEALVGAELVTGFAEKDKGKRRDLLSAAGAKVNEAFATEDNAAKGLNGQAIKSAFKALESKIMREAVLKGQRIDGRSTTQIRPILAEVGILPRTHGSALFTRGETQGLTVATLGTSQDEQLIDAIEGEYKENFMLHYNFPSYSVGETGRMGAPGRREIGHGKLAWRSLRPLLPTKEQFPYTLRLVTEITESNGSSSMATVCSGSLALMDAGVPLVRPVAGIAMGLIKEPDGRFAVLSDILGDEDHLGDMDFKVAGTEKGITALQMDLKIASVTEAIMKQALAQAKDGRLHILGEMSKALTGAREELNSNAPRINQFKINPEKIREVIGTGGKVIREICETTGAKIDIEDDGTVRVYAADETVAKAATDWIMGIAAEPELNHIYEGTVVKIMDFGAFVNFMGSRDGLVHISQVVPQRIASVRDFLNEGDKVKVKVLGFDDRGKIKLSMKEVDQETGEDLSLQQDNNPPSDDVNGTN
ncbi:MAG TPA: polyribonucleotide nucleotidyltransferase [Alphaproteobacteria bacterium]